MTKALVIGGTGIIGNHVIRSLLQQGVEVRALSRGITSSKNLEGLQVESVKGDLNNAESLASAMRGCEWVFHTAAYYPTHAFDMAGHVRAATGQIEQFLKAFESSKAQRLIYTSSLTTLGFYNHPGRPATEFDAYDLRQDPHPYFRVKKIMEDRILEASKKIPAVIVNPTGCFGPFELKPPSFCLVPQLINGKMPAYVDRTINAVDVADVGNGHVLAALKGKVGERYILGGHDTSTGWVIHKICEIGKVSSPKLKAPMALAIMMAMGSELAAHYLLKSPPLFPVLGLRFIQYGQACSSDKAIRELGYKPSPMEPCFERAIEWFRKIGYC